MAFNPQFYAQARPDLQNNWQAAQSPSADQNDPVVQFIRQFPSFEAYMQNDFQNNPNAEAQQASVSTQPANTPAATGGNIGQIQNTPVQTQPTGGFDDLLQQNQPQAITPPTITPPPNAQPIPGSNYNQNQTGQQAGTFNTTGSTQQTTGGLTVQDLSSLVTNLQNQNRTSGSTNQNTTNTTGQQASTGQQTSVTGQTGVTGTAGTSTSAPVDTLGFGDLLKSQQGMVAQNDVNRSAFLDDVMQTGGTGFQSQVEQGVRRGISGPGLTGGGDSARARAAGYSAAEAGRQNLGLRLNAAQQQAGPTGAATLSTAANPFIGGKTTNTGITTQAGGTTGTTMNTGLTSNVGQQSSTGTQTGFDDLVGSSQTATNQAGRTGTSGFQNTQDSTSGNAASSTGAQASGIIPEGQTQSSGGGCIVCTVGIELGLWKNKRILRKVVAHKLNRAYPKFRHAAAGYFHLFTPFAKVLLTPRLRWLARLTMPIARAVVYEELRVAGRRLPLRVGPWLIHWTWHMFCVIAGKSLPIPGDLTDPTLLNLTKKHNVHFKLGGPTE